MSFFQRFSPMACWCVSIGLAGALAATAGGAEQKGKPMSYGEVRDFVAKHTDLIELTDAAGGRVAVAPKWQGRVMTSTCGGLEGASFGFVNRDFIQAGKPDLRFNNFGAEERMWLCPEGGPFALWFKPGAKQEWDHWYTPPGLNEGPWQLVSEPGDGQCRMTARLKLRNAADTPFEVDVARDVRLLARRDFGALFGARALSVVEQSGVKMVGYETSNKITNRLADFSKETGLLGIWILGMMNAAPDTVVIVPYKPGPDAELGPAVRSEYFGFVPPDRLKVTPEAVLFRSDGKFRSKIGTSQRRARNVLGSIDFQAGVLTLVHFTMPDDPTKHNYINNVWGPQAKPFAGDVANAYNDGPNAEGKQLGAFYEIESVSPAPVLKTGESLVHRHRTIHVQADAATLGKLARETLGVDLDAVRKEMLSK